MCLMVQKIWYEVMIIQFSDSFLCIHYVHYVSYV